uniref:Uncharacterized protein n=1 Tax=Arundo donax TaxID=35708 RepID=A0A0A9G7D8_ARUDO
MQRYRLVFQISSQGTTGPTVHTMRRTNFLFKNSSGQKHLTHLAHHLLSSPAVIPKCHKTEKTKQYSKATNVHHFICHFLYPSVLKNTFWLQPLF